MEVNLAKIKPSIKKYIKEFEKITDDDKFSLKFTYLEKANKISIAKELLDIIDRYIDNIMLEYHIRSVSKDISNKNSQNILSIKDIDKLLALECVPSLTSKSKLLGSGYFGEVYELDSNTAVKITRISIKEYSKINIKKKLKLEYNISKKAGDLGIGPKIFNHFICKNDDGFFDIMIMENLEKKGTILSTWLDKNKNEKKLRLVLNKIKEKVSELHKQNIIHSDIHPDNIFVIKTKNNYNIKIIDFGLASTKKNIMKNSMDNEMSIINWQIRENLSVKYYIKDKLLENQEIKLIV